jgi:hypothetical protein
MQVVPAVARHFDAAPPAADEVIGMSSYLNEQERILGEIGEHLSQRGDLHVQGADGLLSIMPAGEAGFPIAVRIERRRLLADFGGCRQDFDDIGQVAACIDAAVSGDCRLRIDYRNGKAFAWTLEDLRYGAPRVLLACGYPSFGIWPFRAKVTSRTFAYPRTAWAR